MDDLELDYQKYNFGEFTVSVKYFRYLRNFEMRTMIPGTAANENFKVHNKDMLFGQICRHGKFQWMMIWSCIIKSIIFGEFNVFQEFDEFFNYDHDPRCKNTNKK